MNENLKDHDVLLVKEKDSEELKVVKGINPNGKLDTVSPKPENQPDFMKIDRHGNALDNFLENFSWQFKNPTDFLFFKAPADKAEEAASSLQAALKNPEAYENKQFLDMHKVEPPTQTQKEFGINPDLVDWEKFKDFGISQKFLEYKGKNDTMSNAEKLLDHQKTDVMFVSMKLDDELHHTSARFSLRKQENGTFAPKVHFISHKPNLERPYFGIKFTEEDKQNLLKTGNLGRVVEAEFKQNEKTPILLSLDKQTNALVSFRQEWLKVPDTYKGAKLDEEQKQKLANGEKVEIKGMISTKGNSFDGEVQFNADKRYFELIIDNNKKQSQSQKQNETKGVHIPKKILGVDLTEKQQSELKAGKAIYVVGMKDHDGEKFDAYIKVNVEKKKLDFFKFNPDKAQKQGAGETKESSNQDEKQNEKQQKKRTGVKM